MFQGGSTTLFKAGSFEFQTRHLVIVAVLAMTFSVAMIMRAAPIKYGFYLNEFDPYFDYRATKYILDNGLDAYWHWHDNMSWYPEGRNIPGSSQSALHITAAALYSAFGGGSSLMDFTIMLPVVLGSLTVIVVFALVRVMGGTAAGLFAAVMFAVSPPIILRGNLGWFKSEPLGLFLGLLAAYLFISAIRHRQIQYAVPKAVVGGLLLGLANGSWGGIQYFSIPIALFFMALPFFRRNTTIPMYVAIAFTALTLVVAGAFPRPGISFVTGLPGIALAGGTLFLVAATFLKHFVGSEDEARQRRMTAFLLIAFVAAGFGIIAAGAYSLPSFRYLNAIFPALKSENALVESVAEHLTPTLVDYFLDFSILLVFAGLGAWIAFQKRNDSMVFALLMGLTGLYVSATFARLLVFASVGVIILAGIGLAELTRVIMERKEAQQQSGKGRKAQQQQQQEKQSRRILGAGSGVRMTYVGLIIAMLAIPMFYPANNSWVASVDVPTAIANGGTIYRFHTNDWTDAMDWMKQNTPKDSVVVAWWDYGYWITTLGERTTVADNATINQTRIESIAKMFIDNEQAGTKIAHDLKADYVLVYVVGQKQFTGQTGTDNATKRDVPVFTLGQGGEESKNQWIMRIAGYDTARYLEQDQFTPKSAFWSSTLLGKLMPFEPLSYGQFGPDGRIGKIEPTYKPGLFQLYSKHVKYPADGGPNQPFQLVYASPSFEKNEDIVTGIFIYKVNHDYVPKPQSDPYVPTSGPLADMTPGPQIAEVQTAQGTFKIEFFPGAAPRHVNNFINLAKKGFYDGTIFHRLAVEPQRFVIQGGDPQTKNVTSDRSMWGTGGPGYTIPAEFNDIPHTRGIVSMARTSDPNSAGSQFFIVLENATFLDNQYTVFGKVIDGMDVVDKISSLPRVGGTGPDKDQPANPDDARILSVRILPREG
jgi:dolichyl-diphosphooligosaccharide--protein glycosyltransferase